MSPRQKPQPRNSFFVKGDAVREKGFQPGVRMYVRGSVCQLITSLGWDGKVVMRVVTETVNTGY